ncbi:uncharacterized protein LOC124462090 [Drosophila willistoni]|uniref:uncharacterized protein LOC124462090 n=1 Tax=Drosophila willistoni TaxID=7260 RepID=UPI001F07AE09|nr:uncharacterized protein LOC124462090 [Drosophila willistoni]
MMKLLHLNLNHCGAAQTIRELNVDVAELSEPYKTQTGCFWAADRTSKAAIWACSNRAPAAEAVYSSDGYVCAKLGDIWLYSCYLPPSLRLEEFKSRLDNLATHARGKRKVVIAGDFNAWSHEWGRSSTNARGRSLAILNTGTSYTFTRADYGSVIDVTFASSQIASVIQWQLSSHYTASDHTAIICNIGSRAQQAAVQEKRQMYRVDALNPEVFASSLVIPELTGDANKQTKMIMESVVAACDCSMPIRGAYSRHHPHVYWWTNNIAKARKKWLRARRAYQRARGSITSSHLGDEFASRRRELKRAIKESTRRCFLQLCDEASSDIWGMAYKMTVKKLKAVRPAAPSEDHMVNIVQTIFPDTSYMAPREMLQMNHTDHISVSTDELLAAVAQMHYQKAPGSDSIPNKALKLAVRLQPEKFTGVLEML